MTAKNIKFLVFGSAIALLAAGCSNAQQQTNSQNSPQTQAAAPLIPANASSTMPGMQGHTMASSTSGHFGMQNLPPGSKPFFGTIASVSGSQVTISGHSRNSSTTVSTIIDITASTKFTGGSQTSLTSGTRIVGVGTANSDGSINATSLQINPTFSGRGQGGGHYQSGGSNQAQSSQ
jgi:hypothetical protein